MNDQNRPNIACTNDRVRRIKERLAKTKTSDYRAKTGLAHDDSVDGQNLPLTFSQKRFWLLEKINPNTGYYNACFTFNLEGNLSSECFEQAINALIRRHEPLRTVYRETEGGPYQVVESWTHKKVEYIDLERDFADKSARSEALDTILDRMTHQPFDLSSSVCRFALVKVEDERHHALLSFHHITIDAWSLHIFMRDLAAYYNALSTQSEVNVPDLPMRYAQYALYQHRWVESPEGQAELEYWTHRLRGYGDFLDTFKDFERPSIPSGKGEVVRLSIDSDIIKQVQDIVAKHRLTQYMVYLGAYVQLLTAISGQRKFLIGTPTANRHRKEVQDLVGVFINSMVLPIENTGTVSIAEFFHQIKNTVVTSLGKQDFPFDLLVEKLNPSREYGINPFYQHTFAISQFNTVAKEVEIVPGLSAYMNRGKIETSRCDLEVTAVETESGMDIEFIYNSDIYTRDTVNNFIREYVQILSRLTSSDACMSDVLDERLVDYWSLDFAQPRDQGLQSKNLVNKINPQNIQAILPAFPLQREQYYRARANGESVQCLFESRYGVRQIVSAGDNYSQETFRALHDSAAWFTLQNHALAKSFWSQKFTDFSGASQLPKWPTTPSIANDDTTCGFSLTKSDWLKILKFSKVYGVEIETIVQGMWGYVIASYQAEPCVLLSVQKNYQVNQDSTHNFSYRNVVPAIVDIPSGVSLSEWLIALQKNIAIESQYNFLSLHELALDLDTEIVFDNVLIFDCNTAATQSLLMKHWPLQIVVEQNDTLALCFHFDGSITNHQVIDQLARALSKGLVTLANNHTLLTSELSLVDVADSVKSAVKVDYQGVAVHHAFETHALARPNAVALYCGDVLKDFGCGLVKDEILTYAQLNEYANRVAYSLISHGIKAEDLVSVCFERSADQIIAVLGILKAGATYVPLDSSYPDQVIYKRLMLSAPALLLTSKTMWQRFKGFSGKTITLEECFEDTGDYADRTNNPRIQYSKKHAAYLLYTSGSTGEPKGISMPHRALVNLISHISNETSGFDAAGCEQNHVLQLSSISFDMSFTEIFLALSSGGHLTLASKATQTDLARLVKLVKDTQVTTLNLPSVLLPILANYSNDQEILFESLSRVVSTAEALVIDDDVKRFFLRHPHVSLINQYGPSETHVVTSYTLSSDVDTWERRPVIGRAISNVRCLVLNAFYQPLPFGAIGELHVEGLALANAYQNQEALTEEKFPIVTFASGEKVRLYKTGDLVRQLPDGNLQYVGRKDDQVKIRGFRVETGEVEHQIASIAEVQSSVVVPYDDDNNPTRLVAYYTLDVTRNSIPSGNIEAKLKALLERTLPKEMIPSQFLMIDEIPLTINGKVDKRALPKPDFSQAGIDTYIAPRNELEEQLSAIWCRLLNINMVGMQDNFFEVGGHSLLAVKLVTTINKLFDIDLGYRSFYDKPEIETLGFKISALRKDKAPLDDEEWLEL